MSDIERDAILRAAADYVEAVLEHGDPALRPGFERFRATVDDVLAEHIRGAVDLLGELSERWADVRVSGNAARVTALGDAIRRARELIDAKDTP
jgi:hypothetical protein